MLITSNDFFSFQGNYTDATGNNFMYASQANALANGIPISIVFNASTQDGVVTFDVLDANTGDFLAGGVGEDGRSTLTLDTSAPD
jgi:hypothetical protein